MPLPYDDEARRALGDALHAYLVGRARDSVPGEEDANERAFRRCRLVPRLLTGAPTVSVDCTIFGRTASAPIVAGAYAGDTVFSEGGLLPLAEVLQPRGLPLLVSEETATPLATLAQAHDRCWLQLRAAGSVDRVLGLVDLAARAGAEAVVLSVLAPVHPRPGLYPGGYSIGMELERRGLATIGATGPGVQALDAFPQWGWSDVTTVAGHATAAGLPLLLKGILSPEDAAHAETHGAAGVIVSNIGLRQSSRWAVALDQVGPVRQRCAAGVAVILDGGVRNGTDVLIALMAGADLAVTTRPLVAALATGGGSRAAAMLDQWIDELAAMTAWMGASHPSGLGADQLVRDAAG